MDVATPLNALPESLEPGHYLGWRCLNCEHPIKVISVQRGAEAAPSPFVELRCPCCEKTLNYPWNKREAMDELAAVAV
jgi:hypothetical protein